MEVMAGLDATTSLVRVAWELVNAILEARAEVRHASVQTTKLLDTVLRAQRTLRHLQNRRDAQVPLWDGLEELLKGLGEDLCFALEKVQSNVTSNERREAGNQLVASARSLIGRGARRQNKETLAIIQTLEEALANLDREILWFIGGEVANGRADVLPHPENELVNGPADVLPHPEHELVTKMLTLASEDGETLSLEVAVSQSANSWIDPSNSRRQLAARRPVGIRLNSRRRDAREGGYEVPNRSKVRFSMSVSRGNWCFYVLTYDRWESAEPRVVFPKSASNDTNRVSSDSRERRVFPNKGSMYPGDLISLKLERSEHVPDDEEGQVSIFLVLTSTPLQRDRAHARERISIQDIERHMNSMGDDELIVKHIPFDIAK